MSLFLSQAKSVQEKLAAAILKESQCSSEPELSDTSTEEEEESSEKGPEPDSKGTRSHSGPLYNKTTLIKDW